MALPRLRQAVLVAAELEAVRKDVQAFLDLPDPYEDPGVGEFGLRNAVFAVGDTFLEIVSPVRDETTASRYLRRRGSDAGYMAIFQVPDVEVARRRIAELGVRVVWHADLADISGTHLHPKDIPGAIVSIDAADPVESWRWAGPEWTGAAPPASPAPAGSLAITGLTVGVLDPVSAAARWAAVIGVESSMSEIWLAEGGQRVSFTTVGDGNDEGISEILVACPGRSGEELTIGSARIVLA